MASLWKYYQEVEMPQVHIWIERELEGVPINVTKLRKCLADILRKHKKNVWRVRKFTQDPELNVNSGDQVAKYLFKDRTPRVMTESGSRGKIDDDELRYWSVLGVKLARMLMVYKKWEGLRKHARILLTEQIDGRIYSTFNTMGTETTRMSNKEPNLQQTPARVNQAKRLRACFEGNLISADYKQIQIRILAHYTGDEVLINAFKNGEDLHSKTAGEIFNKKPEDVTGYERSIGKTVNFGIIFGQTEWGLAKEINITREEARRYIQVYNRTYPKVQKTKDRVAEALYTKGYIEGLGGVRRHFPDYASAHKRGDTWACFDMLKEAFNFLMQRGEAAVLKQAIINVYKMQGIGILIPAHDELLMEVDDYGNMLLLGEVKNAMLKPYRSELKVPLELDIKYVKNWAEGK